MPQNKILLLSALKICFLQKFNNKAVFQIFDLCFVKHWILNFQSLIENQMEKTTLLHPSNSVNL